MKINPSFLTRLLPATVVKLAKMEIDDVVLEHERRIQELERAQLGLPPAPERMAMELVDRKRLELMEEQIKQLQSELEILKRQPYTEARKQKKRFF